MKKNGSIKKRLGSILFWSIVSAAFIGPGTVTTATKAGAAFQFDLMWALVFSTFACLVLQEASARITICSGMNLGEAIYNQFKHRKSKSLVLFLIVGAIILGCTAYETGNILGSVEGLAIVFNKVPKISFVIIIGILATFALSFNSMQNIAKFMGVIVFLMGIAFFTTAIFLEADIKDILIGSFIPKIPKGDGAGLLILGLIGTTVVPYDLFLGSGVLDKKQTLNEMRFGLSVAIILGGIISMSIIVVGTAITKDVSPEGVKDLLENFDFNQIKNVLYLLLGKWAVYIFGFGMFAAGFSSAITSPLASAITAKSLFYNNSKKWDNFNLYFKLVAYGVLSVGLIFGILNVKPIPAIIIAQALNGFILPFISIFLIFIVNDINVVKKQGLNSWLSNIFMVIIIFVTLMIGLKKIISSIYNLLKLEVLADNLLLQICIFTSAIITIIILFVLIKFRKVKEEDFILNQNNPN